MMKQFLQLITVYFHQCHSPSASASSPAMSLPSIGCVCGFFVLMCCLLTPRLTHCAAAPAITEGPVSVTAMAGTNAHFHCAGTGHFLVWEVDEVQADHPDISARGITVVTLPSSGTVQSNLTVPATSENNGTTVRCAIGVSLFSLTAISNYSTLTVLPGVGRVNNVRFDKKFTTIMWDPPSTVGTLDSLHYRVIVVNNDTGVVIVNNTTTVTTQELPDLQPCHYYTANVTACSSEHCGDSVVYEARSPGDYYSVTIISQVVGFSSSDVTVVFTIELNLKAPKVVVPCSGQRLTFETHLQSNIFDITTHPDYIIEGSGDFVYSITTGIERKHLYTVTINLVGNKGVVQGPMLNFTTYHVQHCDVHTDHTSYILVECTFAINSTAPGFVLIQDEHSQYTINTTLQRHEGDVSKGSVNITDLPTGEYRVTVYDEMEDYLNNTKPAYFSSDLIEFLPTIVDLSHTSSLSPTPISSRASSLTASSLTKVTMLSNSVTPTVTVQETLNLSIVVGVVIVCVICILTAGVVITICFYWRRQRHKTRSAPSSTIENGELENRHVVSEQLELSQLPPTTTAVQEGEPAYMDPLPNFVPSFSPTPSRSVITPHHKMPSTNQPTNQAASSPPTEPRLEVHAEANQATNQAASSPPTDEPRLTVHAEANQATNQAASSPPTEPRLAVHAEANQATNQAASSPPTEPRLAVHAEANQATNQAASSQLPTDEPKPEVHAEANQPTNQAASSLPTDEPKPEVHVEANQLTNQAASFPPTEPRLAVHAEANQPTNQAASEPKPEVHAEANQLTNQAASSPPTDEPKPVVVDA